MTIRAIPGPAGQDQSARALPWYRQFWPWFLIAFPLASVFAGSTMLWLAIVSFDGLVVDDYYREGRAINQRIEKTETARRGAISARVEFAPDARSIAVHPAGEGVDTALRLRLIHPTRHGLDQVVALERSGDGSHAARIEAPSAGRWRIALEDMAGTWRIGGDAILPQELTVALRPAGR
jgi:hypothetical protein